MVKRAFRVAPLVFASLFLVSGVDASQINLILSGLDVTYSGASQEIRDSEAVAGGNLVPAEADVIETVVVELDGNNVATLATGDQRGDLLLTGAPSLLSLNGGGLQPLATSGFGFDWFNASGDFLSLTISHVDILLSNTVFFFTAEAVVTAQSLPTGIEFGDTVSLSYVASLPAVQQGGQQTALALASGAMTISGLASVPEPAAWMMLVAAAAAGVGIPIVRR